MSQLIAKTILAQLGGSRFLAMTGAKHLTSTDNSLSFTLPRGTAADGINHVRIELAADDTYTVTFGKVGRASYEPVRAVEMIYGDQLQEIFTKYTKLYTSL